MNHEGLPGVTFAGDQPDLRYVSEVHLGQSGVFLIHPESPPARPGDATDRTEAFRRRRR